MFILLISSLGYHTLSFSLLSFTAYYDKYHIFICYCRHGITREISIKGRSELYGKSFKHKCSLPVKLNQILQADFISQDLQENSEIAKIVDTIIMNMGIQIMEQLLLVNSMFFFIYFERSYIIIRELVAVCLGLFRVRQSMFCSKSLENTCNQVDNGYKHYYRG